MNKKIIVFDLHNVILEFDFLRALKQCMRMDNKLAMVKICLNPSFIASCVALYTKTRVGEDLIFQLSNKFPTFQSFVEFCVELCNCQRPIMTMKDVILSLKKEGHTLGIFSNIGEYTFTKLQRQYPDIFALFDIIHTASRKNNWLQKPHKQAYEYFLQQYNIDRCSMIFIDDKKNNIKAARACGIAAVHFKSSVQCYHELQELLD